VKVDATKGYENEEIARSS